MLTRYSYRHYWVVDALDEAIEGTLIDELSTFLSKIDDSVPLKVFMTSRPGISLDNFFAGLPTMTESATLDDTLADIQLYVKTSSAALPVSGSKEREGLVNKLVSKSGGSFLWTALVMKQLRDPSVVTVEHIHAVLDGVPEKMSELYMSNLKKVESSKLKASQNTSSLGRFALSSH